MTFKQTLQQVPGFRTNKLWKKILAVLFYIGLIGVLLDPKGVTAGDKFIATIETVVIIGILFVIVTNLAGVRNKLPLFNSNKKSKILLGYLIVFIILGLFSGFTGKMYSEEYKMTQKVQIQSNKEKEEKEDLQREEEKAKEEQKVKEEYEKEKLALEEKERTQVIVPTEKKVPTEYKSALRKAGSYSKTMYMSKAGIYDQLTSEYGENFSAEAAQYAIDNVEADWKGNALKKAYSYQDGMAMSPNAIYDQLVSEYGEKFTYEEAQYAIDNLQ